MTRPPSPKSSEPRGKRWGVLDIGSNSVRFVIYDLYGAAFTPIYNEKVLAGLGRELTTTGKLSRSGKQEALEALRRFALIATAKNLDAVHIGATAALRMASDAKGFIKTVKRETGWDISPISGEQEARLTAQGLISAQPRASGIAADLGGSSLELINITSGQPGKGISYPVGPFLIEGDDLDEETMDAEAMRAKIMEALDAEPLDTALGHSLYLIGGAWRNLAGVHQSRHLYPLKMLQGYRLMPGAAQDLARWAYGAGRPDLLSWPGMNQRRAETLPYSGLMLDILIERLRPREIIISTAGLREGLLYDALPKKLKARDALVDGCRDLAHGNLQDIDFAEPLASFLAPIDDILPRTFDADNEARLRRAAGHLIGIGKGLHPDYRAGLVFEDVLYAPLSGLTHKERAYLALILYHSFTANQTTPNQDAINLLLNIRERQAALAYGTAIRLGIVASGHTASLLSNVYLVQKKGEVVLKAKTNWHSLLSNQVQLRLNKLAGLLGMSMRMDIPRP